MPAPRALSPRSTLVLAIVLALSLHPGDARAKAKPARCKAGQVKIIVGKKAGCIRPGKPATGLDRAVAAQLKHTAAKLPKRHRKAFSSQAATRLRALAVQRLRQRAQTAAVRSRRASAAAAAGGCSGAPTSTEAPAPTRQDGTTVTTTSSEWDGGGGWSRGAVIGADAVKGTMRVSQQNKTCVAWDPCPSADGVLHGTFEYSLTEIRSDRIDGQDVRLRTVATVTAEMTAHVGDDARVEEMDYVVDGVLEGGGDVRKGGKLVKHIPTQVHRVHSSRAGIDPRHPDEDGWKTMRMVARGPHGTRISNDMMSGLGSVLVGADGLILHQGIAALLRSEHHFNEEAACLPVTLTPGAAKVQPGERVPVEVRITDAEGHELALPFTVRPSTGTTDVTSGTAKATVTWTAPQDRNEKLYGTFDVRHVSRRGVADGGFEASWAERPPRFAAELSYAGKFTWQYAHKQESNVGTDSECVSTTTGNGYQWLFFDSYPGAGGTAELHDGVPIFDLKPVSGTMTQDGKLTTANSGPASYCQPASASAPTDGCGTLATADAPAYVSYQADGTVKLEFSNWRQPEFPGSCPVRTPDYGDPLSPDLAQSSTAPISLADLKDPSKKVIVVHGVLQDTGHEDCLSEGDGGPCPDDPHTSRIRYEIDATSDIEWTLKLTRLDD